MNTDAKDRPQPHRRLAAVETSGTRPEPPEPTTACILVEDSAFALIWTRGIAELLYHYRPAEANLDAVQNIGWLLLEIAEAGLERWRQENYPSGS